MIFEHQSKNKKILFIIFAAVLLGGISFFVWPAANKSDRVYCTQEAKLCPDGSYVGRTGPNCEFAECPENDSLSGFANDQLEKAITEYLLTQERLAGKREMTAIIFAQLKISNRRMNYFRYMSGLIAESILFKAAS